MTNEVNEFIKVALSKGVAKSDISTALQQEGWTNEEIRAGLNNYGDTSLAGVPVPRRKSYTSAKEGFLYLLTFVTLYISAFNFGNLIFDFIDRLFPDQLELVDNLSSMRLAISSLIVAYPIYLWLTILNRKALLKDPSKKGSKVRKWLIYFTLFIASSVIIGDLIGLLLALLSGELSIHFLLKVLTIMVIASMIFGYYRWELWHDEESNSEH
jgi:hypothetical protein